MRLVHANAHSLVGETIVYRHSFWLVNQISKEGLHLTRGFDNQHGKLSFHQLNDCRLYPSEGIVEVMYPRILRVLQEVCVLTRNEAISTVQGYILNGGRFMGAEAVARLGGALPTITHAVRHRHKIVRSLRAQGVCPWEFSWRVICQRELVRAKRGTDESTPLFAERINHAIDTLLLWRCQFRMERAIEIAREYGFVPAHERTALLLTGSCAHGTVLTNCTGAHSQF